ncbi:hypothetical protein L7F22_035193 [Adiantum nelumboides]|nr:hypothetical protein [Adiantum nelumboides]
MFAIEALLESLRFSVQDVEELCEQSEDCMGRLIWLQDQSCWYLPFTFLLRSDWPHPPSVVMWSIRDAAAIFGTQEDRLRTWTLEMVSGKIVKEHKVVEHGKVEFQSTFRGRKALALRSSEDQEDIKRWREERKRSYPTSGNILRKADEKRKREAEGETNDEEAQQRRQRMMDIVKKQKELGYQVPEIPSHYFRTHHNRQLKKSRLDDNSKLTTIKEENSTADGSNGKSVIKEIGDTSIGMQKKDVSSHDKASNDDNQCHRNGHFKKGNHNKFPSWQDRKRARHNSHPPAAWWQRPSLLSQLLSKDIEAENSLLLQCCRFIVNNAFLQASVSTSLKHFGWIEALPCGNGRDPSVDIMDPNIQLKLEVGEEASTSNYSPPGEESYQVLGLKNSKTVTKEVTSKKTDESVTDKDVICCKIEDAPVYSSSQRKGKANEDQNLVQPERDLHGSRLQKGSGIVMSNTDCNLQMHSKELPNALVELNHGASDMVNGGVLASWKPRCRNPEFVPRDLEAGEVASGNSESVVEDEEDISQYMNLDVSGADSGCCYD